MSTWNLSREEGVKQICRERGARRKECKRIKIQYKPTQGKGKVKTKGRMEQLVKAKRNQCYHIFIHIHEHIQLYIFRMYLYMYICISEHFTSYVRIITRNKRTFFDKMFCHKQSNSHANRVHWLPAGVITSISTACVWLVHEKFTVWHEQRFSSCVGFNSQIRIWRANRRAAKHDHPS